ncbi:MAG: NAD(P)/FAD-dependent oxidoreductase [Solirubrobacterales bacterium]
MKYVIIGASAAGISAAKTLRELDPESQITVISKDKDVYSRCMLHLVISGERDIKGISFIKEDFFETNRINWIKGHKATGINENEKKVILDDNSTVSYDKLLIASGASASIPPVKNLREANNVSCLRNIEDSISISDRCKANDDVVIIGAGLVGIDAAVGLINKGAKIHLIEMADRILPMQLDKKAASRYESLFTDKGVDIISCASVKEVTLNEAGSAKAVALSDGRTIPCSYIVVAAGVKPNMDFINGTSVKIERGIVIDNHCKTTTKDIFAAGDVTGLAPIWPVAVKMGKAAAYNMTGTERIYEDFFAFQNSMNFYGLETVSLGMIEAPDSTYTTDILETKKSYKKIVHKDHIIYGAILQGDIAYCGVLDYLIKNKVHIEKTNNIFSLSFADFYGTKENGEYIYSVK